MNKELTEKLWNKYPKIFEGRYGSIQETLIPFGFECSNGWYNLIDILCSNLQWNTDHNNTKYVIKNKILRILVPTLQWIVYKIPGKWNLNKRNILVDVRHFLSGLIVKWKGKLEFIKIDTGKYPQIEAVQVKEKFGGLRFYVDGASEAQHAVISFAESLSYHICETCGSMKNVGHTQGWIQTLCKKCAKGNDNWLEDIDKNSTFNEED